MKSPLDSEYLPRPLAGEPPMAHRSQDPGFDKAGFPNTLIEWVLLKSKDRPEQVAFFSDTPSGWVGRTHRRFHRDILAVSRLLRHHGIHRGHRVGVLSRPCYEWEVADKAILYLGATTVGLDPKSSPQDLACIVAEAGLSALFAENRELLGLIDSHTLQSFSLRVAFSREGSPALSKAVVDLEEAFRRTDLAPVPERPLACPEDVAVIIYTSGTTGRPKGIPLTHRQLSAITPMMRTVFEDHLGGTYRTLAWVSLCNGTGRMMSTVNYGLDVVQYFVRDPHTLYEQMKAVAPDFLVLVPRFLEKAYQEVARRLRNQSRWRWLAVRALLASRRVLRADLWLRATDALFVAKLRRAIWGPALRFALTGSAPVDPKILRFFASLGVPVYEVYGLSEIAVLVSMNRPGRCRYGSVGQPLDGVEVKIAPDQEILVKTPAAMRAYLGTGHPELLDESGYLRTGDLGELRQDYLYITGRKKELIKTSTGQRISPVAIENVYKGIAGLEEIVVFGNGRRYLTALVTICGDFARRLGAQGVDMEAYLRREFEKAGRALPSNRRIQYFKRLEHPFSVEEGDLTPTLKLRREAIENRYRPLIEDLYREPSA